MNSITRLVALIGLLLQLDVPPSWGQLVNPTVSDSNHNTAGGTSALPSLTIGMSNTAFGFEALLNNDIGNTNTATGHLGLGPMISSERYKQDILPMGASSEGVLQLQPVTFSTRRTHGG
jgi:hypothetical protein